MKIIFHFRINSVSNEQISGDGMTDGFLGTRGSRAWFFVGMLISFGSLFAACWILFAAYVIPGKYKFVYLIHRSTIKCY